MKRIAIDQHQAAKNLTPEEIEAKVVRLLTDVTNTDLGAAVRALKNPKVSELLAKAVKALELFDEELLKALKASASSKTAATDPYEIAKDLPTSKLRSLINGVVKSRGLMDLWKAPKGDGPSAKNELLDHLTDLCLQNKLELNSKLEFVSA